LASSTDQGSGPNEVRATCSERSEEQAKGCFWSTSKAADGEGVTDLSSRSVPRPRGVFRDGNRHDREGNGESQLIEDGHAENGSTADRPGRQVSGEFAT
jgi:hypothetical protein